MKAIVQDNYGTTDVLRLEDVDPPTVGPDDVLVRVRAAGVDMGTWHVLTGTPLLARLGLGLRRPRARVPGSDVAGTVEAVGSRASGFAVGDDVYGIGRGSFAELVAVPAAKCAPKPPSLTFEEAAAVPVSGLTGLQAVRGAGGVTAGDRVLVIGAGGGVGSYAVQVAKALGAHVTGLCSPAKADLVRALGADEVLDRTRTEIDEVEPFDVIVDTAGNRPLGLLRRALTARGTAVLVGGETDGRWLGGLARTIRGVLASPFVRQRFRGLIASERATDLEALTELIEAGAVTPAVERTFALTDAAAAIDHVHAGRALGKVVLVP